MTNRTKAYLALIINTAIWGFAGPVIKHTLSYVQPFTFLFYRFLISTVIILPFFLLYLKKNPFKKTDIPKLTLLALMSTTINLSLIFLGYEKTTALDGTLIGALTPIFIVLGGALFLREKITRVEKVGLTIAVAGTVVTVIQPFLEKAVFAGSNMLGNILILVSGLEWAAFTLIAKDDLKKHSPFLLTAFASVVGFISFIPLAYFENQSIFQLSEFLAVFSNTASAFGIGYMAILSYLLAYYTYHIGLRYIEASEAAIFSYLQPAFAAPLAVIWLQEKITLPFFIGATIIGIGVFLTEYKPGKLKNT